MKIVDWNDILIWPFDNLFYSRKWLNVLSDCYGFDFKCITGPDHSPSLIFSIIEDVYGKRIISLPFSDYTTPAFPENDPSEFLHFLRETYPGIPITLRLLGEYDLSGAGFTKMRDAVCHRVSLDNDTDEMWHRTSHAFKKGVAKAERSGLTFEIMNSEEGVDIFYGLLVRLRKNKYHILPQSKEFYLTIYEHFISQGNGFLCIVRHGAKPVASAVILQSGAQFFDKMGVSDLDFQEYRPNNLLLWEIMKLGKSIGVKALDMGLTQTNNLGLVKFKESLGGVPSAIGFHRFLPVGYDIARETATKTLLTDCTSYIVSNVDNDIKLAEAGRMLYKYFC